METLKILVVDDELGMRLGVERALRDYTINLDHVDEELNFQISQAESGEKALEMIGNESFDILLLDLKLPGIDGLEVLEKTAEFNKDMLIIMITAYASIDAAVTATKKGAFDFLAKPFTPKELKSTIRKASEHLTLGRRAKKLAEEKRQIRFQFISVLAHELKAPLGAIEGYLNIVKAKTLGDDIEKYTEILNRCVSRIDGMRKMIADLTDLTRIESGNKSRELTKVNLVEVAKSSIETSLPMAEERKITIELNAPEMVNITADKSEIEIIFNNLITNAIKYNFDEGKVSINIKKYNGQISIEVADTGIGMEEYEANKLFNEFVRIKNESTKNIPGSGLGLSIVKKLAAIYEGNVSVSSKPGSGSTFKVVLKNKE